MKCRLLELPAELRAYIYELAVVTKRPIVVEPWALKAHPVQPPLTQVSRQIRGESLPAFFSQNAFEIDLRYSYFQYRVRLPWIPALQASHLKHVTLRLPRCPRNTCYYTLDLSGQVKGSCLTLESRCSGVTKCEMDEWYWAGRTNLDCISPRKMTKDDLEELVEILR